MRTYKYVLIAILVIGFTFLAFNEAFSTHCVADGTAVKIEGTWKQEGERYYCKGKVDDCRVWSYEDDVPKDGSTVTLSCPEAEYDQQ